MADTQSLLTTLYPKMAEPITKAMSAGWTEEEMKGEMLRRVEKAKYIGADPAELFGLTDDTQKAYDKAVNDRKTKILSEAFGLNQDNLKDTVSMSMNMGLSPSFAVKNMNMFRDIQKIRGDLQNPLDYVTEKVKTEARTMADAGRIMSTFDGGFRTKDDPTSFNNVVGYSLNKPFSALIEKPIFALNQLGWQSMSGLYRLAEQAGWDDPDVRAYLDGQVEYWSKPEVYGDATRYVSAVEQSRIEQAELGSTLNKIAAHTNQAATDLVMMITQMHMFGAAIGGFMSPSNQQMVASNAAKVLGNFKNLALLHGTHAFLTTSGTLEDRVKAGLYRVAYNSTPIFVNETLGLTGGRAIFADFASNSILTSPHYWEILNSDMPNPDKVSMIIPQLIMDFCMSISTRGSLENRMKEFKDKENLNWEKALDDSVRQYAERVEGLTGRPADEVYKQQMEFIKKEQAEYNARNFIERDEAMKRELPEGIDPWDKRPEPVKPVEVGEVKDVHEEIGDTGEDDDTWFDPNFFRAQAGEKSPAEMEREELQRHSVEYRQSVLKAIAEEGGINREGTGKVWGESEAKALHKALGPHYMKKGKGVSLDKLHQVLQSRGVFTGTLDDLYEMLISKPSSKSKGTLAKQRDLPKPKDIRADRKGSLKIINEHFGNVAIGDFFMGGGKKLSSTTRTNREEMKGLVRYMVYLANRAESPSVRGDFNHKIRQILDDYDLHLRQGLRQEILTEIEADLKSGEGDIKNLAKADQFRFYEDENGNQALKESLNTLTVKELTSIVDTVLTLREEGRVAYEVHQATKKEPVDIAEREILKVIGKHEKEKFTMKGTMEERAKEKVVEPWKTLKAWSQRPARNADAIDGFKEYAGPTYRFFIEQTDMNTNYELTQIFRRRDEVDRMIKDAGITQKDLKKPFFEKKIPREWVGVTKGLTDNDREKVETYSLEDCLDIYAGLLNKEKTEALIYGNEISQIELDQIKAKVESNPKLVKLVWDIIGEYKENFPRFQKALLDVANYWSPEEDNYTPMPRKRTKDKSGNMIDDIMEARRDEIMRTHNLRKQHASRKRGYERIKGIPFEKQEPLKLGLIKNWMDAVNENEHFIAHAQHVRDMHALLGDPNNADLPTVAKSIEVKFGKEMLDAMRGYVNRVAVPDYYKSAEMTARGARWVKQNIAMAYLGYNLLTIGKQIPSLWLYGAEAGPQRFLSACYDLVFNHREVMNTIHTLDPEMRQRSIEMVLEQMKREDVNAWKAIEKKIGTTGMKGIQAMDKMVTSIGWWAVYQKELANGKSPAEAALRAKRITLNTQPAAQAKELAQMYAGEEWFNLFIMFTNQLNNVWNIGVHDIWGYGKRGDISHAGRYTMALLMSSIAMYMVQNGAFPEDEEDLLQAVTGQAISSIPLAGKYVMGSIEGYRSGSDPFQKVFGGIVNAVEDASDSEFDYGSIKQVWNAVSLVRGTPFTGPRRIIDAGMEGEDPVEIFRILMGWDKPGSKKNKNRPW